MIELKQIIDNAHTGLDAIKRAPILNYKTDLQCLRIQDVSQNKQQDQWGYTKILKSDNKYLLKCGDIIIARTGATVGVNKFISKDTNAVFNNGLVRIQCKSSYLPYYIFLNMQTNQFISYINSVSCGTSAQPNLQIGDLLSYKIRNATLSEQQHIVNILGSIDDKIENNEKIIASLNQLATKKYEFCCNQGFQISELGQYIVNYDKNRKPLSSRERESLQKTYPYYGATEILDYVDEYIFDGDYVLLGEDGTVIDSNGYPIIQRVVGKFWANNHAHILQGNNSLNNNLLEVILKNTKVNSIVTGAVQLKINQANMNSLKIKLPYNYKKLQESYLPIFRKRQHLLSENERLNKLKQLYLHKFFE